MEKRFSYLDERVSLGLSDRALVVSEGDTSVLHPRHLGLLYQYSSLENFRKARNPEGVYSFSIGGKVFKAKALEDGWVTVTVGYGGFSGTVPKTADLTGATDQILNKDIFGVLDVSSIRILYKTTDATRAIDCTTTDSDLILRLKNFETLQHKESLNAANDSWVGTNQGYLRANANGDFTRFPANLDQVVFVTELNSGGFHWIPARGNHRPTWTLGEIPSSDYFSLLVRA